jgi:hypothetical protein
MLPMDAAIKAFHDLLSFQAPQRGQARPFTTARERFVIALRPADLADLAGGARGTKPHGLCRNRQAAAH